MARKAAALSTIGPPSGAEHARILAPRTGENAISEDMARARDRSSCTVIAETRRRGRVASPRRWRPRSEGSAGLILLSPVMSATASAPTRRTHLL